MREIKFRGKTLGDNVWVFGDLIQLDGKAWIMTDFEKTIVCGVHPETVGQFIGLFDKANIEIFEGDIVDDGTAPGVVRWLQESCRFVVFSKIPTSAYHPMEADKQLRHTRIIGNIHENSELLTSQ